MNIMRNTIKYMHRYGICFGIKSILRKKGLIKSYGIEVDNLPIMEYCKKLPVDQYPKALSEWYERSVGRKLNLENPILFTEKIQWLKLYDSVPLKTKLADKYLAPIYVKDKCGDLIQTIQQYGVWDNADNIDFNVLPQKFVLKCNHGSGMNIIVKDKKLLDIAETRKKLNNWMKLDFAHILGDFELHYSDIEHKIIAEEYIQEMDGDLHDYKIHCFNGEPRFVQLIGNRDLKKHTGKMAFYDTDWNRMDITTGDYPLYEKDFVCPEAFDDMLCAAKILAEPFAYVRVDLYVIRDNPFFGELTFTPAGGCYPNFSAGTDELWGRILTLPKK